MPRHDRGFLTLEHQFRLAQEALHEAENHIKAHWYSSAISHSYQVAHRAAAGLLFDQGAKIFTDQEVRYGFSAQFVATGKAPESALADYDQLAKQHKKAEWDHEYTAQREEADEALAAARRFWDVAKALAGPSRG
jgi:uncharacterized protein (UPF0332 family)